MKRDLDALADGVFDLLVIGGGIYGACVAREAVRRGLRVALVERDDFGAATSHNSLKIIHGGIRYTQHLDLPRLVSSARELRRWMTLAPELVRPQQFVIPLYGHGTKGPEAFTLAALLHNALTAGIRDRRVPSARVLSRERCAAVMPSVDCSRMNGGGSWFDGFMADANRLLQAILEDAARHGAVLANHLAAVDLPGPEGRVEGAAVENRQTGRGFEIRARLTVNCAGPGAAGLARRSRHRLSGAAFPPMARAMNLILDRELTAGIGFGVASQRKSSALVDRGGRMFFLLPWQSRTLIGTAHLPFEGEPDGYRFSEAELQDFLDEVNEALPTLGLARDDVTYCYSGLTPAARQDDAGEVRQRKRGDIIDHRSTDGVDGLISVVGIKYTTARHVAERVVAHAMKRLGRKPRPVGPDGPLPTATLLPDPVDEASLVARCEAAIRDEMALRLGDVIFRRTRLGESGELSEWVMEVAADSMGRTLGWDADRRRREIDEVTVILRRHRGPSAGALAAAPAPG